MFFFKCTEWIYAVIRHVLCLYTTDVLHVYSLWLYFLCFMLSLYFANGNVYHCGDKLNPTVASWDCCNVATIKFSLSRYIL